MAFYAVYLCSNSFALGLVYALQPYKFPSRLQIKLVREVLKNYEQQASTKYVPERITKRIISRGCFQNMDNMNEVLRHPLTYFTKLRKKIPCFLIELVV